MPMVIRFPDLLPGEGGQPSPPGARFLDPGLGRSPDDLYFLPPALPMEPRAANRSLRRLEALGREFSGPGDLAALKLGGLIPEAKEGLFDIKDALAGMDRPEQDRDKKRLEVLVRAQTMLLLALSLQERALEMAGLEKGLSDTWDKFGQSLGLEDGDSDAPGLSGGMVPASSRDDAFAAWPGLLRAMAAFLPEDAVLAVDTDLVLDAWKEKGILPGPAGQGSAPEGWLALRAPLAALAGLERVPEDEPWLGREVDLFVPADCRDQGEGRSV